MAYGQKPFGLVDADIYPIDAAGALGTAEPLPVGQVVGWTVNEDRAFLTGYGVRVATHPTNTSLTVTLTAGGIPLELYALLMGETVVTSGTTPTGKKVLESTKGQARPYVAIIGKALDDEGGDFMVKLHKVNFGLPAGTMNENEFIVSTWSGEGIYDDDDMLYSFAQHETAVVIPTSGAF